jgi:signal transduction histidine kinase
MAVMNDLAVNHDSSQSPEARIDAVPESIMENTEFFSLLSHELRTPLATIKGFAQTLIAHWDEIPEDRRRRHVEQILRSTVRLERLVGDLSLSSRLVDGVSLQPSDIDVADVVSQAIGEAQALYPTRHFQADPPPTAVHLWADRERLLQVLVNLLDNAAKYSPVVEPILVRWMSEDSQARLEVHDAGISLTEEEQTHLFTRYGRLKTLPQTGGALAGSGLGLYICKGLVEAMSGHIGIESGEQGSGNTFWFTLPLATD